MKTKMLNLVMLLGFIVLSTMSFAQTTIYINAGETLRVKCWSETSPGVNESLDTDCQVNLSGTEDGEFADTIITTGPFYMEAGNADADYLYYTWSDFADEHTHLITDDGQEIVEWIVSKYNQSTGYEHVGFFWVIFEVPVVTYDAIFTVTDGTNPISGATVSVTGEGNQSTNGSGNCTFADLADGTYDYTVTATGYDAENSSFTVAGGNVAVDVTMTETTAAVYVVNFTVNASSKGIVGATVTLTGYGNQVTDGSGNCSFTDIPDGTYNYSVSADNYEDENGQVTVAGGNVQENVYMDPLSLHDMTEIELNVYPNPCTDYVTIAGVSNVQWAVYSITGQEIMRGSGEKVDMYNLNTGYYMLKVITEEGSVVKRILKQ